MAAWYAKCGSRRNCLAIRTRSPCCCSMILLARCISWMSPTHAVNICLPYLDCLIAWLNWIWYWDVNGFGSCCRMELPAELVSIISTPSWIRMGIRRSVSWIVQPCSPIHSSQDKRIDKGFVDGQCWRTTSANSMRRRIRLSNDPPEEKTTTKSKQFVENKKESKNHIDHFVDLMMD